MSLAAFAAYTCNSVMPGRLGGFVQAWLLGKKESISKSTALGTVALIRVMDGITLVMLGVLVFSLMSPPPDKGLYWESFQKGGLIFTAFAFAITILLFTLRKNKKIVEGFSRVVVFLAPERFKPVVEETISSFWKGFEVLNHPRYLLIIVFLSLTFWVFTALSIVIFLKAFGVDNIPLLMPFFVLLAQVVGFMIPTPGNVGPFHATTVIALSFYGIAGELALSVAIVMHASLFMTNTVTGLIYLWFENIKISDIRKEAEHNLEGNKN